MADLRFFKNFGPFRLSDLAEIGGASLHGEVDGDMLIRDVAALDAAGEADITFLDNNRYVSQLEATRASVCVIAEKFVSRAPKGVARSLYGCNASQDHRNSNLAPAFQRSNC